MSLTKIYIDYFQIKRIRDLFKKWIEDVSRLFILQDMQDLTVYFCGEFPAKINIHKQIININSIEVQEHNTVWDM